MRHLAPLPLVPGSWDDIVARAALKMVDWAYDRLSQRVPTLATATAAGRSLDPVDGDRRQGQWREREPRS